MTTKVKRVILVGIDAMQLCQVQHFVRQGALPNFERLLAMGSAGELLPELPAWTPTNWGTIATGAYPGSTKLAGWFRRQDETDLDGLNDLSTFSSLSCPADTIWEAVERAGLKSLSIFHPLTWPPRTENGMVVAPLYTGAGITPLDISKSRVWTTKRERIFRSEPLVVRQDGEQFIADVEIAPAVMELAKEMNFGDKPASAREKTRPGTPVPLRAIFQPQFSRVEIFQDGTHLCTVGLGSWSDWITLDFGPAGDGCVRFYLVSCDEQADYGFTLAHSSIYPTRGFTYPDDIAEELMDNVGPFVAFPTFLPGAEGDASWFDEYEYQGLWMARVAKYLLETRGWALYYQHYHCLDTAMHRWQHGADPESGSYDPDKAEYYVQMIRRAYEVTDTMLGAFMEMMDEHTVLIAVSDHGCIASKWEVDYPRVLENAGLLTQDESGIVWEKTKAFMISQRTSDIYINLQGKLPEGIVSPAEYENVQEEIIDALLDLRDLDGKRVVAYALKKKDAQTLGHYGKETGDVVFVMNAFYGRATLPKGVALRRAKGSANHATMIATTRTEFSSDLAAAIIAGPGIRKGYVRDDEENGLWKLIDIAPTIAHLFGIQPPRDSRGSVMYDLFELIE